jgi:hypothetical protein
MDLIFAVPNVGQPQWRHRQYGLIGDRLYIQKIVGANGKNFIIVSVMPVGGLGVAIALPLSMLGAKRSRMMIILMI